MTANRFAPLRSRPIAFLLFAALAGSGASAASGKSAAEPLPAFPGALGWAAHTPGGRGARGDGWVPMPAADVQDWVIRNVGARPWDRDHTDSRIVADTIEGRGRIIDSEREVGGHPRQAETHRPFDPAQWDLRFMTPRKGYGHAH